MSDFITNGASVLPGVKTDLRSPTGADTEWNSTDANQTRQALLDLRTQVISYEPSSVNPMDWGATGDGVADDSAAVQSCVDYCLTFTPPKAMLVTQRHRLASSVNIDRAVNTIADKSYFRILGQGDKAGFYATSNINLFSSTIARVGADVKSGRVHFQNICFETDVITRTTNVLDEKFMRVTFLACTFHYIRCYNYTTAFTQEFRWQNCLITEWAGVFASSVGSFNAVFLANHIWDLHAQTTGLFQSTGSTYSANTVMAYNVIEGLGGPIGAFSGAYGCVIQGNQIEYIVGSAFTFSGASPNSNISFSGNYCILYSGPFVAFGTATAQVLSTGNNITVTQFTAPGGTRVLYGSASNVTNLLSIGDNSTAADGLSGTACTISDSTHVSHMNGIERHGSAREAWTDSDSQITKDAGGAFAIGRAPVSVVRLSVAGVNQAATNYIAAFYDSVGQSPLLLRNDLRVTMPSLANFASNALALAGGLTAGDLYRNGGVVQVVT